MEYETCFVQNVVIHCVNRPLIKGTLPCFHMQAHCPVDKVSVADDLSSILFSPHNVAYLGLLQPNTIMQDIIEGKVKML